MQPKGSYCEAGDADSQHCDDNVQADQALLKGAQRGCRSIRGELLEKTPAIGSDIFQGPGSYSKPKCDNRSTGGILSDGAAGGERDRAQGNNGSMGVRIGQSPTRLVTAKRRRFEKQGLGRV